MTRDRLLAGLRAARHGRDLNPQLLSFYPKRGQLSTNLANLESEGPTARAATLGLHGHEAAADSLEVAEVQLHQVTGSCVLALRLAVVDALGDASCPRLVPSLELVGNGAEDRGVQWVRLPEARAAVSVQQQ
jgi:hypothetical protein